jgi:NTE family protein
VEDKNNYKIGLALSGGGSRAIAFHLGCMRALHKHKILEEINVISSVSGGSVINALYSYFDEDFVEFDKKIVSLLERGLKNLILKEFIFSKDLISELVILALKPLYYTLLKFGITLPLQRKHTRTTSFIKAMNKYFFYNKKIDSKRKNGINVIINATEMRTNTAFRFGNKETGCLRFGKVDNNEISVAEAVVASAAYPVLLPAIDCNYIFKNKDKVKSERVIISDGGMYDNLGVTR